MIQKFLVLGAGSAGLIAALSIKRAFPLCEVQVVRSPEIGVIGVGEGSTTNFVRHLFGPCEVDPGFFYKEAQPTWKMGIRFEWGPRKDFYYSFAPQTDVQWQDLRWPHGYYCDEEMDFLNISTSLMSSGKAFLRQANGNGPDIQPWYAFHFENKKLVSALERCALDAGVEILDGKMVSAERGPAGVSAILLEDGRRLTGDLFVDCSGFRSELLGRTLEEPYLSYDKTLFCDRAIVAGYARTDEPILAYTRVETMEAGWAWQIEHETYINRGYVYSSQAISDDDAAEEFLRKNPKIKTTPRSVKFRSGRYQRMWVDNVVALGNSGGFVEPLEATALMVVCSNAAALTECMKHTAMEPTASMRDVYNAVAGDRWDDIRDFLALHYITNTRIDNPFWRHCREDTEADKLREILRFYRENGPSGLARYTLPTQRTDFGIDGYLSVLVGTNYPYRKPPIPQEDLARWKRHLADNQAQAALGMDVKEALSFIRNPNWRWNTAQRV